MLVTVQDNPLFVLPSVAAEARSLRPVVQRALDRVPITTGALQGDDPDADLDLSFMSRLFQFGDDAGVALRRYDSMASLLA